MILTTVFTLHVYIDSADAEMLARHDSDSHIVLSSICITMHLLICTSTLRYVTLLEL